MTGDDIFEVSRIAPAGADTVFNLVAMLHPEVTREGWAEFVRDNSQDGARPRGVFALRDARAMRPEDKVLAEALGYSRMSLTGHAAFAPRTFQSKSTSAPLPMRVFRA